MGRHAHRIHERTGSSTALNMFASNHSTDSPTFNIVCGLDGNFKCIDIQLTSIQQIEIVGNRQNNCTCVSHCSISCHPHFNCCLFLCFHSIECMLVMKDNL